MIVFRRFIVFKFVFPVLAFAVAVLLMPLRKLVSLYMYIVSLVLLLMAHHLAQIYVEMEIAEPETYILNDTSALKRLGLHLTVQCVMAAFIAYLIDITSWRRFVLLIYTLPMIARIAGIPLAAFEHIHHFCSLFTVIDQASGVPVFHMAEPAQKFNNGNVVLISL